MRNEDRLRCDLCEYGVLFLNSNPTYKNLDELGYQMIDLVELIHNFEIFIFKTRYNKTGLASRELYNLLKKEYINAEPYNLEKKVYEIIEQKKGLSTRELAAALMIGKKQVRKSIEALMRKKL